MLGWSLKTTAIGYRCFYFVPTKSGFYQSNNCDFQVKAGKGWLVGSTSPLVSVSKTTCVPNWDACLLHYWQSLGSVLGNWEARRRDLIYEVVYIYIMIIIQLFVMAKCSTPIFKFPQVETTQVRRCNSHCRNNIFNLEECHPWWFSPLAHRVHPSTQVTVFFSAADHFADPCMCTLFSWSSYADCNALYRLKS